jgi:ABC-2 type transport system ATP-binding protein
MDIPQREVNATETAISVRNLSFAYVAAPVLREVSFNLKPGAVGLLGPNGSGKTTLLRALLGHLPLAPGAANVLGHDMARSPRAARRRLGWMPERGGILPGMSGVGMVSYLGELSGMPARDALQRAHEVIDYVGLAEERYRPVLDYSQGMRQRIKLAQALVHDPAWIFLDEPTSGLDPKGRVAMLELVRDLAVNKGLGVLLSTHLLPDVQAVCTEILVLREGRLLAHERVDTDAAAAARVFEVEGVGDEAAFTARLGVGGATVVREGRFALVTLRDGRGADVILEAAAATGFAMRRMRRQVATLEDVFFDIVKE